MLRIEGSAYFGAAQHVADKLHELRFRDAGQKHLLVMARSMNFIDLAGVEVWETEATRRKAAGGDLYFHRPRSSVLETWRKTGFLKRLGKENFFESKTEAIAGIFSRLDPGVCKGCTARIFRECGPVSPNAALPDDVAGGASRPAIRRWITA